MGTVGPKRRFMSLWKRNCWSDLPRGARKGECFHTISRAFLGAVQE